MFDETKNEHASVDLLDKTLGREDTVTPGFGMERAKPSPPQPVNQATMECHRGPCRHFWALTSRYGESDINDRIQIQRTRQCNCHFEPTDLAEANVYHCGMWWPRWLLFVPESLQHALRTPLRKFWERILKWRGYDFSWRYWKDDVFESDADEARKHGGLGYGPMSFVPGQPGRKMDGGIEFNTGGEK